MISHYNQKPISSRTPIPHTLYYYGIQLVAFFRLAAQSVTQKSTKIKPVCRVICCRSLICLRIIAGVLDKRFSNRVPSTGRKIRMFSGTPDEQSGAFFINKITNKTFPVKG